MTKSVSVYLYGNYILYPGEKRCFGKGTVQPNSTDQILLAARLYYVDGLPQAEVARLVKVSQAQVSRLLAAARERGFVKITVTEYQPRLPELEQELQRRLQIEGVVVIKTVAGLGSEETRQTLARFAAPFITALLKPGDTVAIAGGRTIAELIRLLDMPPSTPPMTIVQAMGNVDTSIAHFDALELGKVMAGKVRGHFVMMNAPAFVPDKKSQGMLLALPPIQDALKRLEKTAVALVGIGSLENSVFIDRGALSSSDLDSLRQAKAVGEICGRFYDAQGRECETPWRDRVISIPLPLLQKVPQVIALVAGADRAAAVVAAARGGLVKTVVLDESAAQAIANLSLPTAASTSKARSKKL